VKLRGRRIMMGRFLMLITAFLAIAGGATFAGVHIISAVERQSTTTTYSMKVGSVTRQYEVVAPTATLSKSAPIVVVLGGADSTTSNEISRDEFVPGVNDDKDELVYPAEIDKSWNAIGCCDGAAKENVNDVGFIEALVPKIDPGRTRPIYVVGYSNGGRLAYRLACTDPTLFDGTVALKADPMPGCVVSKPQNILVFSSLNDKFVPYKPGEKGEESPPATVQIARLQTDLKCSSKPTVVKHGTMTLSTWSCANGKTLEWALYQTGGHDIPDPDGSTPGALPLILSFAAKTAPAPVPA
jgi:polyhydroxybutyrate depolymerase